MTTLVLHRVGPFDGLELTRLGEGRFEELLRLVAADDVSSRSRLTFDDGDVSVFDRAFPMMSGYGTTGTVFVCPDWVGRTGGWRGNPIGGRRRLMGWDQLRELSQAGWEIGSHGLSHRDLTALSGRALRHELEASADRIAATVGSRPATVAYPYGRVDDRVAAAAHDAGYSTGFATMRCGAVGDPMRVRRVPVYATDTIGAWKRLLSGAGNGGLWRNRVFGSLAAGSAVWQNVLALRRPAA